MGSGAGAWLLVFGSWGMYWLTVDVCLHGSVRLASRVPRAPLGPRHGCSCREDGGRRTAGDRAALTVGFGQVLVVVSARSSWALGRTGGSDWNGGPLDEGRAALAGQYLCSPRELFKAFIYAVLGDLEFFASHLGTCNNF